VRAPVQILVIGVDRPSFTGEVLAELERLRTAGIVRLVDVLLVQRDGAGTFETLAAPTGLGPGAGDVVVELLRAPPGHDEETEGSTWSLADAVPPGTTAAVALIEHLWAGPLRDAVQRVGGRPLEETWLAPDDLLRLDELTRADG
jgi:hypothetical protein